MAFLTQMPGQMGAFFTKLFPGFANGYKPTGRPGDMLRTMMNRGPATGGGAQKPTLLTGGRGIMDSQPRVTGGGASVGMGGAAAPLKTLLGR